MEDERVLIENFVIKTNGETKNKMRGRRLEGHILGPRNKRMERDEKKTREEWWRLVREARAQKGM